MEMALTDLVHARWTEEIQTEWIENLLIKRPDLTRSRLERTISLMNQYVRDALIKDYQQLIPELELPDPEDRHVLAAAIHGGVKVIITFNLKDFPDRLLEKYNIVAKHPDPFLANLMVSYPNEMIKVISCCQERLKNPPKTINEYLTTLENQGLPKTVSIIKAVIADPLFRI